MMRLVIVTTMLLLCALGGTVACSILDGVGLIHTDGGFVPCNIATHQEAVDQDGISRCCVIDNAVDSLAAGETTSCDAASCLVLSTGLDAVRVQCCDVADEQPYKQDATDSEGHCCEPLDAVSAECRDEGTCVLRDTNTVDC